MMRKRLTVIIPGYNTPKEWWIRCVDSVRNACGPDDEILCIDDGSKEPVCANWISVGSDSRVRLIRKENGGLASARNRGMEVMQGKYVTFVDSDDEVRPEVFKKCIESIEKNNADIAIYGVEVFWVRERLHKIDRMPEQYYGKLSPLDVINLLKVQLLNYACNKVYCADFITGISSTWNKKITFRQNGMPCEDIIFNLECIMAGAKWAMVDYVGYNYYRTEGSLLSSYKPSNNEGVRLGAEVWKKYADSVDEQYRNFFKKFYCRPEKDYLLLEWKNIWRKNSPYSLVDRWRWLREHRELGGVMTYMRTGLFFVAYRHLYFTFIRRWHIRRICPNARNIGYCAGLGIHYPATV